MEKIEGLKVSDYIKDLLKQKNNKIMLVGNYNGENVGDNAILKVILHDLEDVPGTQISIPTRFVKKTEIQTQNIFKNTIQPVKISLLNFKFIKDLFVTNIWIIGGGTIFSKYLGFFVYLIPLFCIIGKLSGKKIVFYSIGYEKSTPDIVTNLMKFAFRISDKISVRDYKSYNLIKSFGVGKEIDLIADPVLRILNYYNEAERKITDREMVKIKSSFNLDNVIVGVFNFLREEEKTNSIKLLIQENINRELTASPDLNTLLISFYISDVHPQDDTNMNDQIAEKLIRKPQIVREIISPFTAIEIMKISKSIFAQRLHSMILAHVSGKDFVAIPYQDKCIELLDQMDHKSIINFKY